MNSIQNQFKRIEQLLQYRRRVLELLNQLARDKVIYEIQHGTNLLFYKAIVEEMRNIVAAYDAEFKSQTIND